MRTVPLEDLMGFDKYRTQWLLNTLWTVSCYGRLDLSVVGKGYRETLHGLDEYLIPAVSHIDHFELLQHVFLTVTE